MKRCCHCHLELPKSDFYQNRHAADGLTRDCKECRKSRQRLRNAGIPFTRPTAPGTKTYRQYLQEAGMVGYYDKLKRMGFLASDVPDPRRF